MIRTNQSSPTSGVRTLEYAAPLQQRHRLPTLRQGRGGRGKRAAARILVWGAVVALVGGYVAYRLSRPDPNVHAVRRNQCAANLRYLGVAIEQYAAARDGKLPATLEDLVEAHRGATAAALVCPASGDQPASGATPAQQADTLRGGGAHVSYVYLGRGLFTPVAADVVLMYEPSGHHGGDGANVLFGDGRVVFVTRDAAQQIVEQVAAGASPVVWPPRSARPTAGEPRPSARNVATAATVFSTVNPEPPATVSYPEPAAAPPPPPKPPPADAVPSPAEQVRRTKCHSNLLRLGDAIARHARRNGGRTPARLEDLVLAGRATPSDFVCPSSHDTPAPGGTPAAWAARLSNGGHRSYVYPKQSAGVVPDDDAVILYESSAEHHGGDGAHVLLGDGRVEFVTAEQLEQIRRRAADGPGPVMYTAEAR